VTDEFECLDHRHDIKDGRLGRDQDEVGQLRGLEGDVLREWRGVNDGEIGLLCRYLNSALRKSAFSRAAPSGR
jgi:hypothetical protein